MAKKKNPTVSNKSFDDAAPLSEGFYDATMPRYTAAPERTERTWGETALDTGIGAAKGILSGVHSLANFASAAATEIAPDLVDDNLKRGPLDEFLNKADSDLQFAKSNIIKKKEAELASMISDPQVSVGEVVSHFLTSPTLFTQVGIESLGSMAVGLGVAGGLAKVNAIRALMLESGVARNMVGGAGESMMAAGDTFAQSGDADAAGVAGVASMLTNLVTPGNVGSAVASKFAKKFEGVAPSATAIDDAARMGLLGRVASETGVRGATTRGAGAMLAEGTQEFGQEFLTSAINQKATAPYNDVDWGAAAKSGAVGAILGAGMGAGFNAVVGEGGVGTQEQIADARAALNDDPTNPALQTRLDSALAVQAGQSLTPAQSASVAAAAGAATAEEILSVNATAPDAVDQTIGAFQRGQQTSSTILTGGQVARESTAASIPEVSGSYDPTTAEVVAPTVTAAALPTIPTAAPDTPAFDPGPATAAVIRPVRAAIPYMSSSTQAAALSRMANFRPGVDSPLSVMADVGAISGDPTVPEAQRISRPRGVTVPDWNSFVSAMQAHTGVMVPFTNAPGRTVRANLQQIANLGSAPGRGLAARLLATNNPTLDLMVGAIDPVATPTFATARGVVLSQVGRGPVALNMSTQSSDLARPTESAMIHESLHAMTLLWLHSVPTTDPLYRELKDLMNRVKAEADSRGVRPYGTHPNRNDERGRMAEFLAETFTRGAFQQFLNSIPVEGDKSAWGALVEWVARLFTIPDGAPMTALQHAMRVTDNVLDRDVARRAPAPVVAPAPTAAPVSAVQAARTAYVNRQARDGMPARDAEARADQIAANSISDLLRIRQAEGYWAEAEALAQAVLAERRNGTPAPAPAPAIPESELPPADVPQGQETDIEGVETIEAAIPTKPTQHEELREELVREHMADFGSTRAEADDHMGVIDRLSTSELEVMLENMAEGSTQQRYVESLVQQRANAPAPATTTGIAAARATFIEQTMRLGGLSRDSAEERAENFEVMDASQRDMVLRNASNFSDASRDYVQALDNAATESGRAVPSSARSTFITAMIAVGLSADGANARADRYEGMTPELRESMLEDVRNAGYANATTPGRIAALEVFVRALNGTAAPAAPAAEPTFAEARQTYINHLVNATGMTLQDANNHVAAYLENGAGSVRRAVLRSPDDFNPEAVTFARAAEAHQGAGAAPLGEYQRARQAYVDLWVGRGETEASAQRLADAYQNEDSRDLFAIVDGSAAHPEIGALARAILAQRAAASPIEAAWHAARQVYIDGYVGARNPDEARLAARQHEAAPLEDLRFIANDTTAPNAAPFARTIVAYRVEQARIAAYAPAPATPATPATTVATPAPPATPPYPTLPAVAGSALGARTRAQGRVRTALAAIFAAPNSVSEDRINQLYDRTLTVTATSLARYQTELAKAMTKLIVSYGNRQLAQDYMLRQMVAAIPAGQVPARLTQALADLDARIAAAPPAPAAAPATYSMADRVRTRVAFSRQVNAALNSGTPASDILNVINSVTPARGGTDLQKALRKLRQMFTEEDAHTAAVTTLHFRLQSLGTPDDAVTAAYERVRPAEGAVSARTRVTRPETQADIDAASAVVAEQAAVAAAAIEEDYQRRMATWRTDVAAFDATQAGTGPRLSAEHQALKDAVLAADAALNANTGYMSGGPNNVTLNPANLGAMSVAELEQLAPSLTSRPYTRAIVQAILAAKRGGYSGPFVDPQGSSRPTQPTRAVPVTQAVAAQPTTLAERLAAQAALGPDPAPPPAPRGNQVPPMLDNFKDRLIRALRSGALDKLATFWQQVMDMPGQRALNEQDVPLDDLRAEVAAQANGNTGPQTIPQAVADELIRRYNEMFKRKAADWAAVNNQPAPPEQNVIVSLSAGNKLQLVTKGLKRGENDNPFAVAGTATGNAELGRYNTTTQLRPAPGSSDIAYLIGADLAYIGDYNNYSATGLLTNNNIRRQYQTVATNLRLGPDRQGPLANTSTGPQGVPADVYNTLSPHQKVGADLFRLAHQTFVNRGAWNNTPARSKALSNLVLNADGQTYTARYEPAHSGGVPMGTVLTRQQLKSKLGSLRAHDRDDDGGGGVGVGLFTLAAINEEAMRQIGEDGTGEISQELFDATLLSGRANSGWFLSTDDSATATVPSEAAVAESPEGQSAITTDLVAPPSENEITFADTRSLNWFERITSSVRQSLQDKHSTLGRLLRALKDVTTANAIDRFDGLRQAAYGRLVREPMERISAILTANGITREQFDLHLMMLHAEEYNRQIATINPYQEDRAGLEPGGFDLEEHPGSGIPTSEARAYLAEEGRGPGYDEAVRAYRELTLGLQDYAVDSGLETRAVVAAWNRMFPNYTPFRRMLDIESSSGTGTGSGFSVREGISRRAMGSSALILSPLAATLEQGARIVDRGEKARIGQSLLALARRRAPNYETRSGDLRPMWTVNNAPQIRTVQRMNVYQIRDAGNRTMINGGGVPIEFYNVAEARSFARMNAGARVDPRGVEDRVVVSHNPAYINKDNVLVIPENGANNMLIFDEQSPDAMTMVRNLKNMDSAQLNGVFKAANVFSRLVVNTSTGYNPLFAPINFIRDIQSSAVNINSAGIPGWTAGDSRTLMSNAARNTVPLMRQMQAVSRARMTGRPAPVAARGSPAWWLEKAGAAGGLTGVRESFANFDEAMRATQHMMGEDLFVDDGDIRVRNDIVSRAANALQRGSDNVGRWLDGDTRMQVARQLSNIPVWISNLNNAFEGATRVAAFKAAHEKYVAAGMSDAQADAAAAIVSKNVSVNFNRRGAFSTQMNALFPFFNAAMQGSSRLAELLFVKEEVMIDGAVGERTKLTPIGMKVLAALPALGVLQSLTLMAAGFDDEQPPQHVRDRNFIIPTGGKGFVSIPMPLGLNALFNMGREASDAIFSGNPAKHIANVLTQPLSAFNPMGSTPNLMLNLMPAALDIPAAIYMNRDAFDRPVFKEDRDPRRPTPGFTRGKEGASALATSVAELLNTASGGNEYRPGVINWTPDSIEYVVGQLGGGIARETGKALQYLGEGGPFNPAASSERPWYKVPLVGKFVGDVSDSGALRSNMYRASAELNVLNAEYKGLLEDGRRAEARAFRAAHPELGLRDEAEQYFKDETRLRKQRAAAKEAGDSAKGAALSQQARTKAQSLLDEIARVKEGARQ